MFIEPNSVIKIYKNVPLKNDYTDTLYFESRTKQNEYFHANPSITISSLLRNSYQRVNKNVMRVCGKAEYYYGANYLAFQNTSFGNKWFYAFITRVDYINNETVEIEYQIDVIQTYFLNGENGDVKLKECFVEREHSTIDVVGSNILPEKFSPGEYVYSNYKPMEELNLRDMCVIMSIVDLDDNIVHGHNYDGIYGGATLWAFNNDDFTGINMKLADYIQKPDSILSLYLCPLRALLPKDMSIPSGGAPVSNYMTLGKGQTYFPRVSAITGTEDFDGFTPKNKKLYTYPYNYLQIDNGNGNSLPLRYEFFKNEPVIRVDCTITQPIQIVARPSNYKGVEPETQSVGATNTLMNESLVLTNYPQCSWAYNAYENWIAENGVQMSIGALSGLLGTIPSGLSTTSTAGGVVTGVTGIANILTQLYSASIKSDVCRGNLSNANVNISHKLQQFYTSRVHIPGQYAKMIDDFFTLYGYQTNEVKKPNLYARAEWTYTKTNGCLIVGSAPADDIKRMCDIFDNGIRFWVDPTHVGEYHLNNEPL